MSAIGSDLRYAARHLLKNPAFAAVALLTLAIAIGANTAIFSLVNGVLLEPLPYGEPGRLVRVWGTWSPDEPSIEPNLSGNVNPLDALDWRAQNRTFEQLAIFHHSVSTLTEGGEPVRVPTARVSWNFFPLLRVQPHLGRFFTLENEQLGNEKLVVLSHSLWQERFGSDPAVIGKTLLLGEEPYAIVGILPRGFREPVRNHHGESQLWRPLAVNRQKHGRGGHYMHVLGRLDSGVTVEQAQADIDVVSRGLAELYPDSNRGFGGRVEPLRNAIVGTARRPLLVLLAAVGLVLLIACVNLANLFLSRATGRKRELTIRLALGAGRHRLMRQLLTESFVVAMLGGLAGLVLSLWLVRLLTLLAQSQIPRIDSVPLDARVLLFTAIVSVAATLISGFLPALLGSRTNLTESLKETSRTATLGRGGKRLTRGLVVAEMTLSLILLVAAGLMIKSFWRLRHTEPGLDPRNLIVLELPLTGDRYDTHAKVVRFYQQLIDRLSAVGGVRSVAAANMVPFGTDYSCDGYSLEGDLPVEAAQLPCAEARLVSPGYFETMAMRVVAGRSIRRSDDSGSPHIAVVNEAMARRFPGGKALGKRLKWGRVNSDEPFYTVVGIVADVRHFGLEQAPSPEIYTPAAQRLGSYMSLESLVVRTSSDPRPVLPQLRAAIWSIDPKLPLNKLALMEELVADSVGRTRFRTIIVAAFAVLALLLAATGIYGVMSYSVSSRIQEFGLLMALGAEREKVLAMVLRSAAMLTTFGILLGLVAAPALTRLLGGLLHDVSATDPLTFLIVPAVLIAVALLSSLVPALRATRVDPVVALRNE